MGKVIAGSTMSLDGYIADRQGSLEILYPDLEALRESEVLQDSIRTTGAAVMGRATFLLGGDPDWFAGNYEYQVPIFVLTHHPPARHPRETDDLTFTFVTDGIESAIRQAKAAAGDRDVTVIGGASVTRHVLRAGLADELHIDIMPILLGGGLRLFEETDEPLRLERIAVVALPSGRTHIKYRIVG